MEFANYQLTLAWVYRFLAQSLRYPESVWLTDDYWSAFSTLLGELNLHADWQDIASLLDGYDPVNDLQLEYTRLFINAVPHVVAPPYASVHLEGDGSLYGNIAEKTARFYQNKGFEYAGDDLPDHIVNELEFLAILVQEDGEGYEEFRGKLFIPWFARFKEKVLVEANHPFYRVVITLTDFFTREEQQYGV